MRWPATASTIRRHWPYRDVRVARTGTDVAMNSAQVTLVKGDLRGIAGLPALCHDGWQYAAEPRFAFPYNALGIPIAAGVLYPVFDWSSLPVIAAAAMSLSSVSVVGNALCVCGRLSGRLTKM